MGTKRKPSWYDDEITAVAELARGFFDRELIAKREQWDAQHRVDRSVWLEAGKLGLLCCSIPEEYGGGGGTFAHDLAVFEAQGYCGDYALGNSVHSGIVAHYVLEYGNEEQKQKWLPDLTAGKNLAGFGLTEPGAGSDAGATATTAKQDGDSWVINGSKQFITNSGTDITSLVTVTAVTGTRAPGADGRPRKEISTIIVPSGTPGFTAEPAYNKVGWNASDTHPLSFDDARVPTENLLGERGRGYANFLSILDEGRIAIAALATGVAQGCVDESVKYAKERQSFGRPIGDYQSVSFAIARMEARAHTARTAYYHAASKMLAGKPFKKEAAIAKLVSSEAAMDNARMATQIHGGYGFMNEYPVARHYRDSKILEIGEGTTEVQLMLIARELGFA